MTVIKAPGCLLISAIVKLSCTQICVLGWVPGPSSHVQPGGVRAIQATFRNSAAVPAADRELVLFWKNAVDDEVSRQRFMRKEAFCLELCTRTCPGVPRVARGRLGTGLFDRLLWLCPFFSGLIS